MRQSIFLLFFVARMYRQVQGFVVRQSTGRRQSLVARWASTPTKNTPLPTKKTKDTRASAQSAVLNLSTVTKEELHDVLAAWKYPKYRADQLWDWIRVKGITETDQMGNLPKDLREKLNQFCKPSVLEIADEQLSKDGTIKRVYKCFDGQLIESVLMPYEDGRFTACISSQAGCAQGCVFCATGQMGFARQLSESEIFEQASRFHAELLNRDEKPNGRPARLSNIVFMGMGEPLANFRAVKSTVKRINTELGIGAKRVTVSTVGIVPNIRKLYEDPDMPHVKLAVSLHCATDEERDELMPVNQRYGGIGELMKALDDYMEKTSRRISLEWALIEGKNDSVEVARNLGRLVTRSLKRDDLVHVNVIPLNPTGGYGGSPSGRKSVRQFCDVLDSEFGIKATPRVRRGIDIDAGCGQLKAKVEKELSSAVKELHQFAELPPASGQPRVGVFEDELGMDEIDDAAQDAVAFDNDEILDQVDFDNDDFQDTEYSTEEEKGEAARLLNLVKGSTVDLSALIGEAKGTRKKHKR